jgi:hypothetical protein
MSREEYKTLHETLSVVRDKDGNILKEDVAALLKQLTTLRDRMRKRMLLMNMREADIPLNVEKLPTEATTSKAQGKAKADTIDTKLTFFDPPAVVKNYLDSDVAQNMHFGPAH